MGILNLDEDAEDLKFFTEGRDEFLGHAMSQLEVKARSHRDRYNSRLISGETLRRRLSRLCSFYVHFTGEKMGRNTKSLNECFDDLVSRLADSGLVQTKAFSRPLLTLNDDIYLIEQDTMAHLNRPMKDFCMMNLMRLGVCIGVQCGIRPCSLWMSPESTDKKECETVRWKDIKIWQRRGNGSITQITFRRLKGRTNATSLHGRGSLSLYFRTPSDQNLLPVSVPERLIAELLARNLLKEHNTVESVTKHRHFLTVKDEALHLPVFHDIENYE
ncbi:hypothetical protein PRZ48_007101 [Zasmidium cellare]|uniref:Uncharacterized protein n=1 Tax=Zasmidium cellare TaxID=395010 RepID=A0ABR0EIH7_ZASCE|nr:hypothetical protein PRZ48_007101 [Zasmidium cellare]